MNKKILSMLLASTLAFSSYLSAEIIETSTSHLRDDFGGETGWGEIKGRIDPFSFYQLGLFEIPLPSTNPEPGGLLAHVDGALFVPQDIFNSPVNGLPVSGQAYVGFGETDGRQSVGVTFENQLMMGLNDDFGPIFNDDIGPIIPFPGLSDGNIIGDLTITNNDGNDVPENLYQLVIIEREDLGDNNYDVELRYDQIEWFSNDNPFIPEGLTFNSEGGIELFELRGDKITLVDEFRDSSTGSGTPSAPFMPILSQDELDSINWDFLFTAEADNFYAIDPDVAVGYDYQMNSEQLISQIRLPAGFDNNLFNISIWDDTLNDWALLQENVKADVIFKFDDPVNRFRVTGIDVSNNVDPTSPEAFVTEVSFATGGIIDMTQTPIIQFVPDQVSAKPVSAPGTLVLLIGSLGLITLRRQRTLRRMA